METRKKVYPSPLVLFTKSLRDTNTTKNDYFGYRKQKIHGFGTSIALMFLVYQYVSERAVNLNCLTTMSRLLLFIILDITYELTPSRFHYLRR